MNTENYILDTQLPLSQDFNSLKDMALAYIQNHVGNEWTNLNTSDPGITILDQVCYALTELGYCNDFPIEDILTGTDGNLQIKNQFYLPEEILTTSPLTVHDYIKYLIDGVDGVNNVVIRRAKNGATPIPQTYQVYLLIDNTITNTTDICRAAFVYLNKCRNLSELFLLPQPLSHITNYLTGTIEIENKWDLNKLLVTINDALSNYVFPKISPSGYSKLADDGIITDEIFDGPLLKKGWIATASLAKKKDSINIMDLIPLIESVNGIKSVSDLSFYSSVPISNTNHTTIKSDHHQLLVVDFASSYQNGYLQITCNNEKIVPNQNKQPNLSLASPPAYETNIFFGAAVDVQTDLPKGNFRNINSYYSIQNTFPEIFALGPDSLDSNTPDHQIAQSRQLKGYLTLFDQVIANQFSQLANIDKLFSFENAITGTPSDRDTFFAQKDKYQKEHPGYPVPYVQFAPAYFYQSLYDIPHIKPLLKDHDTFGFSIEIEDTKVLEDKSWKRYKQDPYNSYMNGLMAIMNDEGTNLARRNEMLNHLLARHGESPLMIDAYIDGSFYTKNTLQDKVIFKSLYLQNLRLLSYYRYKACNYMAANRLSDILKEEEHTDISYTIMNSEKNILGGDFSDFIFDSRKIDWIERLTELDFIDFSGIELKLELLLGIKVIYKDFLRNDILLNTPANPSGIVDEKKEQALWFIEKRKGFILVEMALLLQYFKFEFILVDSKSKKSRQIEGELNYENITTLSKALFNKTSDELDTLVEDGHSALTLDKQTYSFDGVKDIISLSSNCTRINETDYYILVKVQVPDSSDSSVELPYYNNKLEFLFPDFIYPFNTTEFGLRLNLILDNELPVNTPYKVHLVRTELATSLIHSFVKWHDSLRCTDIANYPNPDTANHAWRLLCEIIYIYTTTAK